MNDGKNNRGAHGDSLRMLDEVSSSNKNPPTSVVRKAKKNDNHAAARVMVSNIGYVAGILDLDNAELARIMGISPSSLYQRKSKPWTFRFGEIEKLTDYAVRHGIPVTAAQFMIPFGPGTVERYGEAVG